MSSRTLVLALCMVALCGVASAQNQVLNPDFNFDSTGWVPSNGTFTRVIGDAHDGNPDNRPSGSGLLTHTGASGTQAWGFQCIENPSPSILAGRTVKFGSSIREGVGPGFTQVVLQVFAGAGCTGAVLTTEGSSNPTADLVFETVSGSYVHPSGSASWGLHLVINRTGIGSLTANFDEVFLFDCDPQRFDLNRDGSTTAVDLVLGANRLVSNITCLPQ